MKHAAPRRRAKSSGGPSSCCCWPLSSHHWFKPVAPVPVHVASHSLVFGACCISPGARRLVRGTIQTSLLGFLGLVLILWLGAEFEQYHMRSNPDTLGFYNSQAQVCGIAFQNESSSSSSNTTSSLSIQSYASASDVKKSNDVVAHCGDCGSCSNPHDINIYDETKNSLFESSTTCAKHALIWGRKTATKCLTDSVGFTDDCNRCWVENIMCDLRKCVFTCILYGLFSEMDGGAQGETSTTGLNPCTTCDEIRCGPAFVECAGANRRRTGILSDIDRDQTLEVCSVVTPEWWKDDALQQAWRVQQEQRPDDDDESSEPPRLRG